MKSVTSKLAVHFRVFDLWAMEKRNLHRRWPAEWEEQSFVQFTFPHADSDWGAMLAEVIPSFVACIEAVSRYEEVLVVCRNRGEVVPHLTHLPEDRIQIVECPTNDTWARDHGAITVQENGNPVLLDFIFNGWGMKFPADHDNLITSRIYQERIWGDTLLEHPRLVLEGGGVETDGEGTLLTTTTCLLSPNRNPHLSKGELETRMQEILGVNRFLWLEHGYLAGDDTDSHIDTLARFCNPETIAYVRCDDPEDEHFEELRKMEIELMQFRTRQGSPYQLVPLPWPSACYAKDGHRLPATYANFLIINEAVLVPNYDLPQDQAALETIGRIFPDREVIGINCRPLIEQHGSLHCISMQYPAGLTLK